MSQMHIHTSELKAAIPQLKAGDRLLLSGTVFTSRDAAHKRIFLCWMRASLCPTRWRVPSSIMPALLQPKKAWQSAPAAPPLLPGWTPMRPDCWILVSLP